jgi:hypothetical protein
VKGGGMPRRKDEVGEKRDEDLQCDQTGSKDLLLLGDEEHHTSSKQGPGHVGESGKKKGSSTD